MKNDRRKTRKIDIGTLRHRIIRLGDLELTNGVGVRGGCHACVDGISTPDAGECWICAVAHAYVLE
jgi:hypothetical protein